MKDFSYCISVFAVLATVTGCTSQATHHEDSAAAPQEAIRYTLQEAEIKSWKSGARDLMDTWYLDFYQEGDEQFLVWENKFIRALEFYSWREDSLSFSIRPDDSLIKRRCSMRGSYIASLDSIYILDPMDPREYRLYHFNRQGELLDTLKLINGTRSPIEKSMPEITVSKPISRRGDWLHMIGLPESSCQDSSTFTNGKIDVALNLKTGESRYDYRYPEIYKAQGSWGNCLDVSRCQTSNGKFLYSFGLEDSVRLTDHQQQEQLYFAGSDYFSSSSSQGKKADRTALSFPLTAHYDGILWDPTHEVYYRMALHQLPDSLKGKEWIGYQPASIIILNKEFQKVGETLLPSGRHLWYQWFVGPDGLYISNHYHHRRQAQLGELSFTRYALVPEGD